MTDESKTGDTPAPNEPWWMDHVREIVIGPGAGGPGSGSGPAANPVAPDPASTPDQAADAGKESAAPPPGGAPQTEPPQPQARVSAPARPPETQPARTVQPPAGGTRPEVPPEHAPPPPVPTPEPPVSSNQPEPAAEPRRDTALRDLEESCSDIERLVRELRDIHGTPGEAPTPGALEFLESPISKLEEAVRGLSTMAGQDDVQEKQVVADQKVAPVQPAPAAKTDRTADLRGSTASIPISSILELLSANRKSGTLCLSSDDEAFTLEILEGDVVHASSDKSTQEQLLGSILVARDKIGVEQLEDFYRRYSPSNMDEPVEGESMVSREDLMSALEEHVQALFNRLYSAGQGTFRFYEGGSSNVEQRIRMNVTRLLLESARNHDERDRRPQTGPNG